MLKNRFIAVRASAAAGLALLLGTITLPAEAATLVTVTSVTGQWTSATTTAGAGGVPGSQIGTNQISWGIPSGQPYQSSYKFTGEAPPEFGVEEGTAFELGEFTHFNYTLSGSQASLLAATLQVNIQGFVETAANPFSAISTFQFTHNETSNNCAPLPGCANDTVTALLNPTKTTAVLVGSILYSFTFSGFETADNKVFSTEENFSNVAKMYGEFVTSSSVGVETPIPGALPLFASGLVGLGMLAWRRKRKAGSAAD